MSNTANKTLSMKQRIKALFTPCKTKQELKNWIRYHLNLDLPDTTVSRYADSNPLEAVWQMYDICVNKNNPDLIDELLYVASRGSGKTLAVAIAELMIILHDQRDVVHVGAILSQAKRCYDYQMGFMLSDKLRGVLEHKLKDDKQFIEKLNMEKSTFNLFDRSSKIRTKTSLEVLPCTLKAVNGPHVPLVVVDEIDTVSGEGLRAFKDISGMLDSRGGKRALRVGISTRKSRYGLMNQQIENAEQAGRTVKYWTALEFTQQCPDERSGTEPTIGYVFQDEMETITEEQWQRKTKSKQDEYERIEFPGEKCLSCPIAALCLGDAKKQNSKSNMLKPISDPIKKAMENGPDWAISQLFNLKPSVEGIIYKEFDERKHVKTWSEMWKILTGSDYPGECDHDTFIKKCHQMKLSCYAGIDWGWSNPSTVVFFFVDNRENVYVVRTEGMTYTNNPTWVQMIKQKWHHMYRCQLYFPDMANPGDAVTMKQEGLPCPSKQTKDTLGGIQVVKKWLKSLSSPMPKMYFAEETCSHIIQEFGMYHYKTDAAGTITEDPAKEHDHWLDALRYALYELFSKSTLVSVDVDIPVQSVTDRSGNFTRTPNAEEFAKNKGLNINTEIDTSKLGKIGKLNDIDKDDEDMSGEGGFLWSL
jgi:radical SAM protein with 4Fe4S-binding SPASM domain